ncbi:hypothetical protein F4808DRAFT_426747 [Astrocystis sublimbata]|nr:hypothetical protein F4808DRAFT_426747 [Astrocystis sublimbata]
MSGNWSAITQRDGWDYLVDLSTGKTWIRPTEQTDTEWLAVPPIDAPIRQTVLNREYHTDCNGNDWTRRMLQDQQRGGWIPLETTEETVQQNNKNHLFLVREVQGDGQPKHWSLVVAPEDGGKGKMYQVSGDAVQMHYLHILEVDIFTSATYADSRRLCELDTSGEAWVAHLASEVEPPRAPSQKDVQENCQDWVVQVIERLESAEVVPRGSAASCALWFDFDEKGARLFG